MERKKNLKTIKITQPHEKVVQVEMDLTSECPRKIAIKKLCVN